MSDRRRQEPPPRPRRKPPGAGRLGLLPSDLAGGLISILAEVAVVAFFFALALAVSILVIWAF